MASPEARVGGATAPRKEEIPGDRGNTALRVLEAVSVDGDVTFDEFQKEVFPKISVVFKIDASAANGIYTFFSRHCNNQRKIKIDPALKEFLANDEMTRGIGIDPAKVQEVLVSCEERAVTAPPQESPAPATPPPPPVEPPTRPAPPAPKPAVPVTPAPAATSRRAAPPPATSRPPASPRPAAPPPAPQPQTDAPAHKNFKTAIASHLAESLYKALKDTDVPIADALKNRAFKDDSSAPEFSGDLSDTDRTITMSELKAAFRLVQKGTEGQAQDAAEHVLDVAGPTINSDGAIKTFVETLISEEVHLRAGGVVIIDNIDEERKVGIRIRPASMNIADMKSRIIAHKAYQYLDSVEASYPIRDGGSIYLVTIIEVARLRWPAVTKLVFDSSRRLSAQWRQTSNDEAVQLLRAHQEELKAVRRDRNKGEDISDSGISEYINKVAKEIPTVSDSYGHHRVDGQGVYEHVQQSRPSVNPPTNKRVMEAALKTALHISGDKRRADDISVIIKEPSGKREYCKFGSLWCG